MSRLLRASILLLLLASCGGYRVLGYTAIVSDLGGFIGGFARHVPGGIVFFTRLAGPQWRRGVVPVPAA